MNGERLSRRAFTRRLAVGASAVAGMLAAPAVLARRLRRAAKVHAEGAMGGGDSPYWWGMVIDLDRCTGCGACVVACRTENNVPLNGPDEKSNGAAIYWMDLEKRAQRYASESVGPEMLPMPCMHCENPYCVKVCPVNATYQTDEGIVAQIWGRCIGCRYCQVACPFGRRYFNWKEPAWPESYRNSLNPDVSTRPKGVMEKCTFCYHRLRRVKEEARMEKRALKDDELQQLPACAEACPAEAIVFGNLKDPRGKAARLVRSPRGFRLLEHVGTSPKVVYLAKDQRR